MTPGLPYHTSTDAGQRIAGALNAEQAQRADSKYEAVHLVQLWPCKHPDRANAQVRRRAAQSAKCPPLPLLAATRAALIQPPAGPGRSLLTKHVRLT